MTREEAIKFASHAQSLTDLPEVKEFYALAESALREQEERENPTPLTLDELREMDGKPVYCVCPTKSFFNGWGIVYDVCADWYNAIFEISDYGKTWLAYRHKPKEV